MFKPKEISHIILAIVILALVVSFEVFIKKTSLGVAYFMLLLLFSAVVILVNILVKKMAAYLVDAEVEHKIWIMDRFGFYEKSYLKKPVPVGLIFPLLLSFLSLGYLKFLGMLEYDVYASKARASKKIGNVRFSELTESHMGLIGGFAILANIILAIVAYILDQPLLAKISIYYAFANILPISNLDGTKIFFGSRVFWFLLAVISTISVLYPAIVLP